MILSQAVEQYILHKRSLGMGFRSEAVRLRAFIRAIGDCDMRSIKPAPVLRFLEGNGQLTTFWFSKFHTLKAFYRYALARDYCTSSPLPLSVPQKPEAFQPYIYTNQDIERLIEAADSRHRYRWLLEPHTVRTLLLLLYGTGLRISEALRLTLADFDTDTGVLTIRETEPLCSGRHRSSRGTVQLHRTPVAAAISLRDDSTSRNRQGSARHASDRGARLQAAS
jgi:integrase/recombinase XerD